MEGWKRKPSTAVPRGFFNRDNTAASKHNYREISFYIWNTATVNSLLCAMRMEPHAAELCFPLKNKYRDGYNFLAINRPSISITGTVHRVYISHVFVNKKRFKAKAFHLFSHAILYESTGHSKPTIFHLLKSSSTLTSYIYVWPPFHKKADYSGTAVYKS